MAWLPDQRLGILYTSPAGTLMTLMSPMRERQVGRQCPQVNVASCMVFEAFLSLLMSFCASVLSSSSSLTALMVEWHQASRSSTMCEQHRWSTWHAVRDYLRQSLMVEWHQASRSSTMCEQHRWSTWHAVRDYLRQSLMVEWHQASRSSTMCEQHRWSTWHAVRDYLRQSLMVEWHQASRSSTMCEKHRWSTWHAVRGYLRQSL